MKKPLILASSLLTLVFLIAACGSDSTPAPQINQVSFTAMDYGFSGSQFIPSGMTEMVMTNTGRELHHQQLLTVPEGMATEDLIAGLVSGEAGPPPPGVEAAGSVGAIGPGATGITALNMTAGDYLIVCFIPNAEGVPHMALG
jgi:hypothetical protein